MLKVRIVLGLLSVFISFSFLAKATQVVHNQPLTHPIIQGATRMPVELKGARGGRPANGDSTVGTKSVADGFLKSWPSHVNAADVPGLHAYATAYAAKHRFRAGPADRVRKWALPRDNRRWGGRPPSGATEQHVDFLAPPLLHKMREEDRHELSTRIAASGSRRRLGLRGRNLGGLVPGKRSAILDTDATSRCSGRTPTTSGGNWDLTPAPGCAFLRNGVGRCPGGEQGGSAKSCNDHACHFHPGLDRLLVHIFLDSLKHQPELTFHPLFFRQRRQYHAEQNLLSSRSSASLPCSA